MVFSSCEQLAPAGDSTDHFLIDCLGLCIHGVSKSDLSRFTASFGRAGSSVRENGPESGNKSGARGTTNECSVSLGLGWFGCKA